MIKFGFQVKIRILESIYLPRKFDNFLILKDFTDGIRDDFNIWHFDIVWQNIYIWQVYVTH